MRSRDSAAAAKHWVEAMEGADVVIGKAGAAIKKGEYRWAAMLLNHVVFADPENRKAKTLLADVYAQPGYRAEAGTWRNIQLTWAQELRHGVIALQRSLSPSMIRATPTPLILDHAAVRLNPDRAKDEHLVINLVLSDVKEEHRITVENSVLIHKAGARDDKAHATVTMKRTDLLETLLAGVPAGIKRAAGAIRVEGKPDAYNVLAGLSEPSASKSATAAPGAERLDVGAAARRDGSTAEEAAPRARPAGWHHRRLVRASAMMS